MSVQNENGRPQTTDIPPGWLLTTERGPDLINLFLHQIAWEGWDADGQTVGIRCACGWEGSYQDWLTHKEEAADAGR